MLPPVRMEVSPPSVADAAAQGVTPALRHDSTPPLAPRARTTADNPFTRMDGSDWPAPSRIRSVSGVPGPDYWQQRADYTITAKLDTAVKRLTGSVSIKYTNNSPDTLRYVWIQLDQNLYRTGSKGYALFPVDSRGGGHGFSGGYELSEIRAGGVPVQPKVNDTMMRLALPAKLLPHGGTTTISMQFGFAVPDHGSDRMGRDGALYEIAQWYPRMAVYDDVRGWNTDPYLGEGEFYLEYGDVDSV